MVNQVLKKGKQIRGSDRTKLRKDLQAKYEKGASVRALAENIGRSYGFVYKLLTETNVRLRPRGGDRRLTTAGVPQRQQGTR
ncbi:helix-turn-helix domain-containing protein [Lentzea sp. NPDC102401]|uniref:helix-turn-helix domain-containing protein n=1 Tax=Lentzea sp. NPDC102401 TaxID=3364128 RepID=UPI00380A3BE4